MELHLIEFRSTRFGKLLFPRRGHQTRTAPPRKTRSPLRLNTHWRLQQLPLDAYEQFQVSFYRECRDSLLPKSAGSLPVDGDSEYPANFGPNSPSSKRRDDRSL